ncbi:hypothetical protein RRG08_047035 [Elysia crispata]|uniref:Uncharacterized protein n=1 Tax=Elysia crispata TaxID=231223 RepID=A0AAE1E5Y6_9GAST|nr:hypothetical protein RRG08_047035 [Elysia crispata]
MPVYTSLFELSVGLDIKIEIATIGYSSSKETVKRGFSQLEMEECLNCKINRSSISSPRSANPSVSAGYSLSSVPLLIQKKKVLEESSVFNSFKHKCILKLKSESILAVNHGFQNEEKIPPLLEEESYLSETFRLYALPKRIGSLPQREGEETGSKRNLNRVSPGPDGTLLDLSSGQSFALCEEQRGESLKPGRRMVED